MMEEVVVEGGGLHFSQATFALFRNSHVMSTFKRIIIHALQLDLNQLKMTMKLDQSQRLGTCGQVEKVTFSTSCQCLDILTMFF